MNKRIKQLAEQARAQVHEIYKTMEEEPIDNFIDWFDEQFEQKFAELLVRECVKEMGRYEFIDVAMREVKEHFGVE
jgi:hypothetical protein